MRNTIPHSRIRGGDNMKFWTKAALVSAMIGTAGVAQAETTLIFGEAGPNRGARAASTNWFAEKGGRTLGRRV
jgi:hypothetical protein